MIDKAEMPPVDHTVPRVFALFCGVALALSLLFALTAGDAAGNSRAGALLDGDHLLAVANVYLLAAPLAWFVALVLGVQLLAQRRFADPRTNFLLLAAVGWVAFTVLWQPDLGAWKDWDLFIAVGFPVTALAAHLARSMLPPRFAVGTLALIVIVHLVRTLPFLAYNAGAF